MMNLISWLLIALFPVLILFSDFPSATISGTVLGLSVTGAVALFVFIWWFGAKRAMEAAKIDANIDEMHTRIRDLQSELDRQKQLQSQAVVMSAPKPISETRTYAYAIRKYP